MMHIPSDVWMEYPLGYFLREVIDYRGKTPPSSDDGIPVISAAHIKNGKVVHDGKKYVSREVYDRWTTRGFVKPGDVLITTEAPVAQVAQLPGDQTYLMTRRVIALQVDPTKGDERFIKYCLMTDKVRKGLEALGHGTTVPRLYKEDILGFRLQVPSLHTQHKIAAILSAYDDLIENNTRRIAILEEMARLLYREWFVHFRFPGHESVPMVDSELGPIPEGWEITAVSDLAEVFRGRSYRSVDLVKEGGLPFLNLKCIERDGGFRHDGLKRYAGRYKDTQKARPGDIVVAVTDMTQERRIIARAARVPDAGEEPFVFSMDLVKLVPREDVPSDYLYGMLRFSRFPDEVKQYASGVNVLHLRPDSIEEFKVALPPRELRERYASLVSVAYKQCDALQKKIGLLRQTRDLLLPRLISGQLDVSGLAIDGGEEDYHGWRNTR